MVYIVLIYTKSFFNRRHRRITCNRIESILSSTFRNFWSVTNIFDVDGCNVLTHTKQVNLRIKDCNNLILSPTICEFSITFSRFAGNSIDSMFGLNATNACEVYEEVITIV